MTARGVFRVAVIATPLVVFVGLLGFCAFVFSLADKNFDVRRGSFDYYALIGSTIRNHNGGSQALGAATKVWVTKAEF